MEPLPLPDPPLRDDVVALRPFAAADAEWVFAACQDPDIQRFTLVPSPYRRHHARAFVAGQGRERRTRTGISLAIVDAGRGEPLGAVGLTRFEWQHRRAEIGYWIAPGARGRGAATRAVRLLATWALAPPIDLLRLELIPFADNHASRRVAEKAGFALEGVLRSWWIVRGQPQDMAMYALVHGGHAAPPA